MYIIARIFRLYLDTQRLQLLQQPAKAACQRDKLGSLPPHDHLSVTAGLGKQENSPS